MKRLFVLLLLLFTFFAKNPSSCYGVNFADGYRAPNGAYLTLYPYLYSADRLTDNKGNSITKDLGLDTYGFIIRPLYYTDNFIFATLIPIGNIEIDLFKEDSSGLGDITFGVGYFLPIKAITILPAIQVKTDTGTYDKNDQVNLGSGQWDIMYELYFNKITQKFSFDGAIKYWQRLEEKSTKSKPGDELRLEALFTYAFKPTFRIGPTFYYLKGKDSELDNNTIKKSGIEKFSMGFEAIYSINQRLSTGLTITKDIESKNSTEGLFSMARITIVF